MSVDYGSAGRLYRALAKGDGDAAAAFLQSMKAMPGCDAAQLYEACASSTPPAASDAPSDARPRGPNGARPGYARYGDGDRDTVPEGSAPISAEARKHFRSSETRMGPVRTATGKLQFFATDPAVWAAAEAARRGGAR